jgi:hypothetical protein
VAANFKVREEFMYRTILCAAAGAAIFAMPAKADETVKWRHVQHTASAQTLEVGDLNGHTIGLFRLPGIAFFPDGSTGKTVVIGTNDTLAGPGSDGSTASGYYTLIFNDGSALWFKYTGTVKSGVISGTGTVIGGQGRYAGAKGDGTWEGPTASPGPDAIQYIDNVYNIKK